MSDTTRPDSSSESDAPSFEEAMEQLEECVSRLESGDLTLEQSLEIFEQGIAASRACAGLLDRSRQRVRVLVEKAGGDFQLDFLDDDETEDEDEVDDDDE